MSTAASSIGITPSADHLSLGAGSYVELSPVDEHVRLHATSNFKAFFRCCGKKYVAVRVPDAEQNTQLVFLNIKEAAKILGVETRDLIEAEERGNLPAFILNRMRAMHTEGVERVRHILSEGLPTGLSEEEGMLIETFVQSNRAAWDALTPKQWASEYPDGCLRIKKEKSGLPRTLEIFRSPDGALHIMVLLKTKGEVVQIGEGSSKKTKLAVDWESGARYANLTIHREHNPNEFILSETLGGRPGLAAPMLLKHKYVGKKSEFGQVKKKRKEPESKLKKESDSDPLLAKTKVEGAQGEKIGYYQHLYDGALSDLLEGGDFFPEDNLQLAIDLVMGLCTLDEAHVVHKDIKPHNIYYEMHEGTPRYFIGDFGIAEDLSSKPQDSAYDMDRGGFWYRSPEQFLLCDQIKKAIDEASFRSWRSTGITASQEKPIRERLVNEVAGKHWRRMDVWSTGITLLQALLRTDDFLTDFANRQWRESLDNVRENRGNAAFYEAMQRRVDALFKSLSERFPENTPKEYIDLLRRMLTADIDNRISPQEALKELMAIAAVWEIPSAADEKESKAIAAS